MKPTIPRNTLIAQKYNPTAQKDTASGYTMAMAMNAEITLLHSMSDMIYYASTEHLPLMRRTDSKSIDPLQIHSDDQFNPVNILPTKQRDRVLMI